VFDLEFNQDFSREGSRNACRSCFEIIQIGAVRLDCNLNETGTFRRFVKPVIYPEINPYVTELTGITTEQLCQEEPFPEVCKEFAGFAGDGPVYCVWGMADMRELYRNIEYHKLDPKLLSKRYINLQPYTALHFNLSQKKLMKLKTVAELLSIPLVYDFHDALNDALYTAEIFRRINKDSVRSRRYDPEQDTVRPRQRKQLVDFAGLILQFEKMYSRKLTEEEQSMVRFAYHMGRTRQFLK
jgi:DNA polymerase III epsilon subunit-like protein